MSHIREVPEAWRDFLSLEDTPTEYTAVAGQFIRVNSTPDGVEFTDDVVQKTGSTMTGFLTLSADPTNPLHAATKQYVDGVAQGIDWKESVRAATTAAITLSGLQTVDGVSLVAGDRVLVKDQGSGSPSAANGIYIVVDGGAWTRAEDADEDDEFTAGLACFVEEGTLNQDTGWVCVTNDPITVGTTAVAFGKFSSPGDYTAGTGLTESPARTFNVDFEDTDGNILELGTADAGTSNKVARADHVHPHGDQGGGTEHLEATISVAGFMSATDKTKLDGIEAGAEVNQNAWSFVDVNGAESLQSADAKTDTLYFVEANVVNVTGDGDDTITFGLTAGSNGQLVKTVAGVPTWAFAAFLELSDTPSVYTGAADFRVKVNSTPDALIFVDDTLLNLNDTPASYAGAAGYRLVVNSTPDAVEFIEDSFLNLSDTPASYTGFANRLVRVNSAEDALEFVAQAVVGAGSVDGQTLVWDTDQWVASSNLFNDTTNNYVGANTAAPHSTLHGNGSFAAKQITVTASYDMATGTNDDVRTVIVNNAAGATISLPTAVGIAGREYHIKKVSATGGGRTVTIDGSGAETIDGSATFDLVSQYEAITIVSDGANWWIV